MIKTGAMAKHLLHATISTALRDDGPKRAIRNLVELGEKFSVGRFQREFFSTISSMLKNENSLYYKLWETVLKETDHDSLKTFGINIGYNGCTAGIKTLRALEKQHNCGIPAVISILYNGSEMDSAKVDNIVRQGEKLGIFAYIITYCGGDLGSLSSVFTAHKDCGFVLLTEGCELSCDTVSRLTIKKNVMLSVSAGECGFEETCRRLRSMRTLYCVYSRYDEAQADEIVSGKLVEKVMPCSNTFVLLIPDDDVSDNTAARVGAFAAECRKQQRYPFILMDVRLDLLDINRAIANSACFVAFDTDGQLITQKGKTNDSSLNITKYGLLDIFRKSLVLEQPRSA
ncbi:MAG: hypothetical protein GX488_05675 [Clostridiales bacterium]|nr:hypothetical protein [Clostridiales bacterium]